MTVKSDKLEIIGSFFIFIKIILILVDEFSSLINYETDVGDLLICFNITVLFLEIMECYATDLTLSFRFCCYFPLWLFLIF